MYCIYRHFRIDENGNEKSYIGKTVRKRCEDRFGCNGYSYVRKNSHTTKFGSAIKKYGWDTFQHEIIAETDDLGELDFLEIYYIAYFNSFETGYNATLGGGGTSLNIDGIGYREKLRRENPSKLAEIRKVYYDKNREYISVHNRNNYYKHKEARIEYAKKWKKKNKDKIRIYNRKYQQKWRLKNIDKIRVSQREYQKKWRHANIERVKMYKDRWEAKRKENIKNNG